MSSSPALDELLGIMAALRTPETGCPWDLEQTSRSIAPYAIEEAYEVTDAIERGDLDDIRDELGDLLLQVVFHARIAEEAGDFTFDDVARAISAKMIRRHPHVFGPHVSGPHVSGPHVSGALGNASAEAVDVNWERIKSAEREEKRQKMAGRPRRSGLLADVPVTLPGLTRAVKLQSKAGRVGFDWADAKLVLAKIREETEEIEQALDSRSAEEIASEIGDLLFAAANLARHVKADPETAVRATNAKFERRFAYIEQALAARGTTPEAASLGEMDALWNEAKAQGL